MDRRSFFARLAGIPIALKALAAPAAPSGAKLISSRTFVADEIHSTPLRLWGDRRDAAERAVRAAVKTGLLPRGAVRDAIVARAEHCERDLDLDLRAYRSFSASARQCLQREREIERDLNALLDDRTDPIVALAKTFNLDGEHQE